MNSYTGKSGKISIMDGAELTALCRGGCWS